MWLLLGEVRNEVVEHFPVWDLGDHVTDVGELLGHAAHLHTGATYFLNHADIFLFCYFFYLNVEF